MTTEDKDLLYDAAKAVGYDVFPETDGTIDGIVTDEYTNWNPLRSNAQAFSLAIKLEMKFDYRITAGTGEAILTKVNPSTDKLVIAIEIYKDKDEEKLIATRRAIVRVAAKLYREQ